ncbi:hypothetical protein C0431_15140 [bacterium]|nr:hypothetical protein [bacterium]
MVKLYHIDHIGQALHHFFWFPDPEFYTECDEVCVFSDSNRFSWVSNLFPIIEQENGLADFLMGTSHVQCRVEIARDLASRFRGLRLAKNYYPPNVIKEFQEIYEQYLGIAADIRIVPRLEWVDQPDYKSCPKCGRFYLHSKTVTSPISSIKVGGRWELGREYERKPGEGYLIPRSIIGNHDAIYLQGRTLLTERVKNYIEFKQYTNVDLLEYGEIVEDIPYTEPTNDAILAKLWENPS